MLTSKRLENVIIIYFEDELNLVAAVLKLQNKKYEILRIFK